MTELHEGDMEIGALEGRKDDNDYLNINQENCKKLMNVS